MQLNFLSILILAKIFDFQLILRLTYDFDQMVISDMTVGHIRDIHGFLYDLNTGIRLVPDFWQHKHVAGI